MALLIAVVLLLMITALGLTALEHAQSEASTSGRARRKDANLYAAEAGMNLILDRLAVQTATGTIDSSGFDLPSFVQDGFGYDVHVRTGSPGNAAMENLNLFTPDEMVDGSGRVWALDGPVRFEYYRPNVIAEDISGGFVHLQAQFVVLPPNGGGANGQY